MGSVRISCASGFRALGIQCIGQSHSEMMVASAGSSRGFRAKDFILLMDKILHDPKDPKLWELWYVPYGG